MREKDRSYYQELFCKYPDVVELPDLREMLGGIPVKSLRKLLHEKRIKHFFIGGRHGNRYKIPKVYVIDYILEESKNEQKSDYNVPPLKISR